MPCCPCSWPGGRCRRRLLPRGTPRSGYSCMTPAPGPRRRSAAGSGGCSCRGSSPATSRRRCGRPRPTASCSGTPWECLDARDRVLRQRPPDLAGAASFAEGACSAGSPRGCVLWAEALGCGRGVQVDVKKGLTVLRRQCDQRPQACLELAIWLDFPGARAALAGSPALANATYVAAADRAHQRPGGPGHGAPGAAAQERRNLAGAPGLPRGDDRRGAQGQRGVPGRGRAAPEARSRTRR